MEKRGAFITWIITVVLVILTGILLFFFVSYSKSLSVTEKANSYKRLYVIVTEDGESHFYKSVYDSALLAAVENDAYVDMISQNLSREYSAEELMEIAIASAPDGIIVSAPESPEMVELISRAVEKNIPVITLYNDIEQSEKLSYVGISNYDLGKEYGNLIADLIDSKLRHKTEIDTVVLVDSNSEVTGQNLLFQSIQQTIDKENNRYAESGKRVNLSLYAVDGTNSFSIEESARSLFVKYKSDLPDIVVCLNEATTTSMYQAVVDYNQVGLVNILGYYDSDAIIKGIDRGVIYATVSVDTDQMGEYCVDALTEYYKLGNTSSYFATDIAVINEGNVSKYLKEDSDEN